MSATTSNTLTAKTVNMRYEGAESGYLTGVSPWDVRRVCAKAGRRAVAGGNGTYITSTYAHFVLTVEVKGRRCEVWTERGFRKAFDTKRISVQLRDRISKSMPEVVEVEERQGRRGKRYYALTEQALTEWAGRANGRQAGA